MGDRLLLVGCGKMGGALLQGWLATDGIDKVVVVEPGDAPVPSDGRVERVTEAPADQAGLDAVILAVKPQMMGDVAPQFAPAMDAGAMAVSIAAGIPIKTFANHYGPDAPIVRVMPNTPAAIGRGVSVLCANDRVTAEGRELADRLLNAGGSVEWVDDEGLMDAVTALSGGGPAYVFLLIEALAKAGATAGLPADMSARLARQTVIGAAELANRSDEDPAQLRRNVTSPGGTTEAALKVLMGEPGIQALFDQAIAAATKRSKELGG